MTIRDGGARPTKMAPFLLGRRHRSSKRKCRTVLRCTSTRTRTCAVSCRHMQMASYVLVIGHRTRAKRKSRSSKTPHHETKLQTSINEQAANERQQYSTHRTVLVVVCKRGKKISLPSLFSLAHARFVSLVFLSNREFQHATLTDSSYSRHRLTGTAR